MCALFVHRKMDFSIVLLLWTMWPKTLKFPFLFINYHITLFILKIRPNLGKTCLDHVPLDSSFMHIIHKYIKKVFQNSIQWYIDFQSDPHPLPPNTNKELINKGLIIWSFIIPESYIIHTGSYNLITVEEGNLLCNRNGLYIVAHQKFTIRTFSFKKMFSFCKYRLQHGVKNIITIQCINDINIIITNECDGCFIIKLPKIPGSYNLKDPGLIKLHIIRP